MEGGTANGKWRRPLGHAVPRRIFSILVSWVVVLSLSFHFGSPPRHFVPAGSDKAEALAALGALVGQSVALCEDNEGAPARGSPSDNSDQCGDTCPLCQLAGHAVTFVSPSSAIPLIFPKNAKPLDPLQAASVAKPRPTASAQPRAPPHYA
jgi:hypothetical protein